MSRGPGRPSWGTLITNWNEYGAPVHVKLGLALKNAARRVVLRSNCCGNHGQPGC
jgi:hypothetical protein